MEQSVEKGKVDRAVGKGEGGGGGSAGAFYSACHSFVV